MLSKKGSKLTGAKITFGDDAFKDVFDEIIVNDLGLYKTFELGFELQPSQSANLLFEYDLPTELSINKETSKYSLYWQKQPGTDEDKIKFKMNSPFGVSIISAKPKMEIGDNTADFEGILNYDMLIELGLR